MQSVLSKKTSPQWAVPLLPLHSYLLALVLIVGGFTLAGLGAKAMQQSAPDLPGLFAAYADIFPGQPRSAMQARGFSCPMSAYGSYRGSTETCFLHLPPDAFEQITVVANREHIVQTSFVLRGNRLTLGDLAAVLGEPEISEMNHVVTFQWQEAGVTASSQRRDGQTSLFLFASHVIVTEANATLCACEIP